MAVSAHIFRSEIRIVTYYANYTTCDKAYVEKPCWTQSVESEEFLPVEGCQVLWAILELHATGFNEFKLRVLKELRTRPPYVTPACLVEIIESISGSKMAMAEIW